MNLHSDEWIMAKVQEHYKEALDIYPAERIVGIFLQGSQNYGLDYESSDVDTKLILTPSFEDLCFNKKPISTTYIRSNEEHIDTKDIRLMFQTFRKQNVNFIEILFTPYKIINPLYKEEWVLIESNKEKIAHYNPYAAVKTMKGIAMEKYYAMEHRYPSKADIIDKYGYDGKQLSHLIRIYDFLNKYIKGENYKQCLTARGPEKLINLKKHCLSLDVARIEANTYIEAVKKIADNYCNTHEPTEDTWAEKILNAVQRDIVKKSILLELEEY